ncbi:MAG: hypothetical protein Kow0063_12890 [Anaerolineae bacterium]
MADLHTRLRAEIAVLSPLHVGSGMKLQRNFDWLARDGRVYVVNHQALFEVVLARVEAEAGEDVTMLTTHLMQMTLADLLEAGWLTWGDLESGDGALVRYAFRGQPAMNEIDEQIKDAYDRPYLPGSSLKGVLRTLLAWGIYRETKRRPDLRRLRPQRSWAAQPLERAILGRDPNHDLLRALRVEDSQPLPFEALGLERVNVFPTACYGGGPGLDLDVEAIRPGSQIVTVLTIDEYGFQEGVAAQLGWQEGRDWLERLPALAREHARQRLLEEAEYFKAKKGPGGALRFYDELINTWAGLGEDEFIVQIGWGGGWDSKTLGSHLKADRQAFERLLQDKNYRLLRKGVRRQPGDPFPGSRRLAVRGRGPALPMGWVKVSILR